jgi:hypothetical protein
MVATWIRTMFTRGTPGAVRTQLDRVRRLPLARWRKIRSTNPNERLNKKVKRRTRHPRLRPWAQPPTQREPPSKSLVIKPKQNLV